MAGGRFLSANDPVLSPDARVRATVGVGNDCEPYADFGYYIAPPGVQLPKCSSLDVINAWTMADPRRNAGVQMLLDRAYVGSTEQIRLGIVAIENLRNAIEGNDVSEIGALTGVYIERPDAQRQLAESLIASGQLTLGPESFTSPQAMAALAAALRSKQMSSLIAGIPPGGSTPFMPFGTPVGLPFLGGVFDGGGGVGPGVAIGTTVLGLAGQFFLQQQQQKAAEETAKQQLKLLMAQQMLLQQQQLSPRLGFGASGGVTVDENGNIVLQGGMGPSVGLGLLPGQQGPIWPNQPSGVGGGCCPTRGAVSVSPMDAPAIYREGCGPCGSTQLITRNQFFALRSDGTKDLFVKVGKVQSVSPRTLNRFARRWAKEAKLSIGSRARRGRRRPR